MCVCVWGGGEREGEIRLTRVGSAGIKKLKRCFTSIETVGVLGMGAQDSPPRL